MSPTLRALLAAEPEVIAHMNADHADTCRLYATRLLGAPDGDVALRRLRSGWARPAMRAQRTAAAVPAAGDAARRRCARCSSKWPTKLERRSRRQCPILDRLLGVVGADIVRSGRVGTGRAGREDCFADHILVLDWPTPRARDPACDPMRHRRVLCRYALREAPIGESRIFSRASDRSNVRPARRTRRSSQACVPSCNSTPRCCRFWSTP